jgi:hypothetical protein
MLRAGFVDGLAAQDDLWIIWRTTGDVTDC